MTRQLPVARPTRTAPPTQWPAALSLDALKRQAGIAQSIDYHDAYLESLREAAVDLVEHATGRILAPGPFVWYPGELTSALPIPVRPVVNNSVQVEVRDASGNWETIATNQYVLLESQESPTLYAYDGWPPTDGHPDGVRISFTAGDTSPPARATQAVLMLVGHWFAQRDPIQVTSAPQAVPAAFDLLLSSLRRGTYP
jgi:uncharacterized phiE125 gp8 family phage protein